MQVDCRQFKENISSLLCGQFVECSLPLMEALQITQKIDEGTNSLELYNTTNLQSAV